MGILQICVSSKLTVEQDGWQFIFLRNKHGRSVNVSKEIKKKERKKVNGD